MGLRQDHHGTPWPCPLALKARLAPEHAGRRAHKLCPRRFPGTPDADPATPAVLGRPGRQGFRVHHIQHHPVHRLLGVQHPLLVAHRHIAARLCGQRPFVQAAAGVLVDAAHAHRQCGTTGPFGDEQAAIARPYAVQLLLRHMAKPADYDNYHGHAYPWIGWEELTNWATSEMYLKMFSCCRSTVPGMPRKVRATTNPYGKGHNWVKVRFKLPQMRGCIIHTPDEPDRIAIHGHISENRILLDADPDYIKRIRAAASNPGQIAAWLDGSWDITSGGMFDDLWTAATHIVQPFQVPRSWYVDRSFDWGSAKPFSVGWWAESDGSDIIFPNGRRMRTVRGDLFRINEWYGLKKGTENEGLRMLATDVADGIKMREIGMGLAGRVKPGPADPAIWSDENGNCIERDMRNKGVRWERADNARVPGWLQVRKLLKGALNLDEMDQPRETIRETPGVFVVGEKCPDFVRTFVPIPRDEKNPDDIDTDVEDHVSDEARYRMMTKRRVVRKGSF